MEKYCINISWSDEEQGFIAVIPEFKNLSAFGKTYEEALEQVKIAVEGVIETLEDERLPIPEPQKLSNYSGQIRVRMPKGLHQELSNTKLSYRHYTMKRGLIMPGNQIVINNVIKYYVGDSKMAGFIWHLHLVYGLLHSCPPLLIVFSHPVT